MRARHRATVAAGVALAIGVTACPASAALDMAIGAQQVGKGQAVSACNAAAKAALFSLQFSAQEAGDTGEWQGLATPDTANGSTQAAAVHCFPLPDSYLVTFTCAVQVPPSTDSAAALCAKLAAAFSGGATPAGSPSTSSPPPRRSP